jgi:hypothetical protein
MRPECPEDLELVDWRGRWIDEDDEYDDEEEEEEEEDRQMEDFDPVGKFDQNWRDHVDILYLIGCFGRGGGGGGRGGRGCSKYPNTTSWQTAR